MTPQQIPQLVAELIRHQECFSGLSIPEVQWIMRNGNQKNAISIAVDNWQKAYLRAAFKPIFTNRKFIIGPCNGERSISDSSHVFKGGVDPYFKSYMRENQGNPTNEVQPVVYDMVLDYVFGENWCDYFEQDQIIEFCEKYPEVLMPDSVTLFPMKSFLASVYMCSSFSGVNCLDYVDYFHGNRHHRVVVPRPLID